MVSLTVIILTFNEEKHIERCIQSLRPLAETIFIIDSFSTDRTVEIAESLGATVKQRPWKNYADQFQWGMDNCHADTQWIMRMDADEYLLPELTQEIQSRLPQLSPDITGVNLKRRHIHMNQWIRHGTRYPLILLRIWRTGKGRIEQRWMDEHVILTEGAAITFQHDFCDHNLNTITWWTGKHNGYATREAIDVLNNKYNLFQIDTGLVMQTKLSQASIKRFVKEGLYNRLPVFVGPFLYFLYRYFLRLGFLDGKAGIVYHFLQGFWYRFLVDVKVMELDNELRLLPDNQSRLQKLETITGLSLR